MSTFFGDLLESVQQMDEIIKGEPVPSCDSHAGAIQTKEIRKATGLTQTLPAKRTGIEVATLQNWEQDQCEPAGSAKTLTN